MPTLEVICASVEDVRAAVRGGAESLELCAALDVGGLTPPLALVQAARDLALCHLNVLVRPHAASFAYDAADRDHIFNMIDHARALGVDGVVFGALTADGTLDLPLMQQAAQACGGLTLTMHRALDVMPDPDAALMQLVGVARRLLTSGGAPDVATGAQRLARWVQAWGQTYQIAAGGGVTLANAAQIARQTRAHQIHVGRAAQRSGRVSSELVRRLRASIATFDRPTVL